MESPKMTSFISCCSGAAIRSPPCLRNSVLTIYLIRHGLTDAVGKTIAGRGPCSGLNRVGVTQVGKLVERLAGAPISAVYSSPLARALQTAEPLAVRLGL